MWSKLWWMFKVSFKVTIKYGWCILTMLLAGLLIGPLVTGDVISLCVSTGAWILIVIFIVSFMMYMMYVMSDEWITENLKKK